MHPGARAARLAFRLQVAKEGYVMLTASRACCKLMATRRRNPRSTMPIKTLVIQLSSISRWPTRVMDRFLHGGAQQSKEFTIERRNATARKFQLNCGAYAALLVDGSSAACGGARQDVNQASAFAIARPSANSRQDYKAETLRACFRVGCRGVRVMWRGQSQTGTVGA
jgi:hypothetical protein